ncbi:MAG: RHS repeat domain-containing protein [Parasphingorhabdus sp.]
MKFNEGYIMQNHFLSAAGVTLAALLLMASGPVLATETTTYEYDALGRLVKSTKSGGPSSGTEKSTSYDAAGNRTNQTVTGAPDNVGGGGTSVIVLPINGFLVIPIQTSN